jgi:hypothetical protein
MFNDPNTLRVVIYLAFAGGALMVYSYKKIKKKVHIKDTVKQIITSASAGSVELEAIAWPFRAIDTDMNGKRIVFRYTQLRKLVRRGKRSTWETVWSKASPEPFLVFDHSGYMIVSPTTATDQIQLTEGLTFTEYNPFALTQKELDSFESFYENSEMGFRAKLRGTRSLLTMLFSSEYKIRECSIAIGSPLLIHAHLTPEDKFRYIHLREEFKLFKDRASKLTSNKNYRLTLLDKNKDGAVDSNELYRGFQAALKSSVKTDFGVTEIKPEGETFEKICGTLSNGSSQALSFAEGFEEQILNSSPIYWNWICLYLGAALVGISLFLMMKFNYV